MRIVILRGEPEAEDFQKLLEVRQDISISAGTLLEARIVAISVNVLDALNDLVSELSIRTVPVDEGQAAIAALAFARYGRGRGILHSPKVA